jgi:hypothetical protein
MNENELIAKLKYTILHEDGDPYRILKEYKNSGGSQVTAYKILQEIREEIIREGKEEKYEDLTLEIMDIVWGWCNTSNQIWDTVLKDEDIK